MQIVVVRCFGLGPGCGRFVSFRFQGTGCLAVRFVGGYGSVRFAEMIGSFRFVSHLFNIFFFFVSFPFHTPFVTSVSSLEEKILYVGELAVQDVLGRIVDLRVCKSNMSNVENAA